MLLEFAKSMRGKPTDAEHRLWQQLRAGRLQHYKFKRQQPMEKYIADFVCFEARLVVELDGGQHNGSSSDVVRDDWLKAQGFIVLRFWNNEVFENLAGVMERILAQLLALPPSLQPLSRPGREATERRHRRLKILPHVANGNRAPPSPSTGEGPRERVMRP